MTDQPETPLFMQDIPAIPDPATLKVGDEVVVIRPGHRSERRYRAVMISRARVWADFESVEETPMIGARGGRKLAWRLRMDDRTDGSRSYYAAKFQTPEQDRLDQAVKEAGEFLSGQGIRFDSWSPWTSGDRYGVIELARLVWPVRRAKES